MSRNVCSEINLHFVWHTRDNAPVLVDPIDQHLHRFLKDRALQTSGVFFHEIGGIEDQVHLVVSVPPTLLISDWIGQMKGSSSYYINHRIANRHLLDWQTGTAWLALERGIFLGSSVMSETSGNITRRERLKSGWSEKRLKPIHQAR